MDCILRKHQTSFFFCCFLSFSCCVLFNFWYGFFLRFRRRFSICWCFHSYSIWPFRATVAKLLLPCENRADFWLFEITLTQLQTVVKELNLFFVLFWFERNRPIATTALVLISDQHRFKNKKGSIARYAILSSKGCTLWLIHIGAHRCLHKLPYDSSTNLSANGKLQVTVPFYWSVLAIDRLKARSRRSGHGVPIKMRDKQV